MENLGEAIRRAREASGMSQRELADALGVSNRTVGNWERGHNPPRSKLGALERLLDVSFPSPGTGPRRDRLALVTEHDADPSSLVGSYFHTEGARFHKHQGCVVAEPSPGIYLVEFFSWLGGESTNQRLVPINDMSDWLFYDTAKWMTNAYEHGGVSTRWEHEGEEG